ncbi:putative protein BRICK1-B [Papilio machaon]|uniref:Protein BRICK1-B n=1 Tax=Papilio machaon TaxID=76193 RepID=A0A194R0X0_PAPMA|nr:putative protein BRICK1-B [Papilio machaon]
MSTPPRETIQKQIQQDWANREYIEVITGSIKKITDFLNSFDMSCRSRLATLNEKLTSLERKIDYLEACILYSGHWPDTHDTGVYSHVGPAREPCNGRQLVLAHCCFTCQQQRTSAVVDTLTQYYAR